jgi:putative transposase
MIRFIEDHRADHGVEPICRILPIAPATFYDHLAKRADPDRGYRIERCVMHN